MKCLIADDSRIIRMLLTKIMSNLEWDVLEAEDGEEAFEIFQLQNPDLIIMDWTMPIMEGIDVLYKVRNAKAATQPKFMFCSSNNDVNRIREALKGGADDYIIKPFDEDIIYSKLAILGLV